MIVINPTKQEIEVIIEGVIYVLPASGKLANVPEKHAFYWKNNLHSFLEVVEDVKIVEKKEVEVKSEPVEVIKKVAKK